MADLQDKPGGRENVLMGLLTSDLCVRGARQSYN